MEVEFAKDAHPNLTRWLAPCASCPSASTTSGAPATTSPPSRITIWRRKRIFWRGDRIEWMLSRGFHDWFFKEIAEGRVLWPGPSVP